MGFAIFAAIACLLAAVLFIPVSLHILYNGNTRVFLRVLGIKLLVSDSSKPAEKSAKKPKQNTEKKQKKKKDLFEMLALFSDLAKSGIKAVKTVVKKTRVYDVSICWTIARGDPYETGLAYGRSSAALYPVLGFLSSVCKVKLKNIDVIPDFNAVGDSYDISLKARIAPFYILKAGLILLANAVLGMWRRSADKNSMSTNNIISKDGALNNG